VDTYGGKLMAEIHAPQTCPFVGLRM
jgi:hypothetical protein